MRLARFIGAMGALSLAAGATGCPKPAPDELPETGPTPVFMIRFGPDLGIPLACSIDGRVVGGSQCAEQVAAGSPVWTSDVGEVVAGPRTGVRCNVDGHGTTAIELQSTSSMKPRLEPDYAVFPANMRGSVDRIEVSAAAPEEAMEAIALATREPTVTITQWTTVNADEDLEAENLAVVDGPDGAWSAIVLVMGAGLSGEEVTASELDRTDDGEFVVMARMDLDGDGTQEVWIRRSTEQRIDDRIDALSERGVSTLGQWWCD